jgi:HK97 family phage major capsid protein
MKLQHKIRAGLLLAFAFAAGAAQAVGIDVAAVVQAYPHIGTGLLAMSMLGEMDTKGIQEALARITDQVKESGQKALDLAQKGVALAEGEKERVDELLVKQGELQAALKEVQQKQARADEGGGFVGQKSMGQQFAENERVKGLKASGLENGERVVVNVKAITTAPGSVGNVIEANRLPGVLALPQRRMTIRDLIMPGQTDSPLITYMRETGFTNNAAPVAEGARKPESNITMDMVSKGITKLAHFIKITTEALADVPMLRSIVDGRLRYGLALREEAQLLLGSGAGNNLHGIYTQATAFAVPAGAAATGTVTALDRLRLALLQSELAEYPSDGIVLNPIDYANIELLKDGDGRYLIGNPTGTLNAPLWGRNVVTTQAMTAGQFLAGAFGMGAQIFDREDATITVATENEDDFVNNLVTILIEERLGLAVYRPEAFIKGAIAAA